ncbi:hypothetical protein [Streptomyces sp. ID05-18]|uniref:hypothetical protein n=1 Tax=Streptomyces sp. ID05-18 TaxID=3028662 RepID=UPI0029A57854|nr:hypothetical protein [Streptomyces sp. ID05-18]MDX3488193.1 hypothetical protein [Streptomyces sp. ID05-18]
MVPPVLMSMASGPIHLPPEMVNNCWRALSELIVRTPWPKTGVARQLRSALLATRREERATLLVDQGHPMVHALYRSWGWGWTTLGDLRPRLPGAPLFHAMLLGLPVAP